MSEAIYEVAPPTRRKWPLWLRIVLWAVLVVLALSSFGVFVRPMLADDNDGHGFGTSNTGQVNQQ